MRVCEVGSGGCCVQAVSLPSSVAVNSTRRQPAGDQATATKSSSGPADSKDSSKTNQQWQRAQQQRTGELAHAWTVSYDIKLHQMKLQLASYQSCLVSPLTLQRHVQCHLPADAVHVEQVHTGQIVAHTRSYSYDPIYRAPGDAFRAGAELYVSQEVPLRCHLHPCGRAGRLCRLLAVQLRALCTMVLGEHQHTMQRAATAGLYPVTATLR